MLWDSPHPIQPLSQGCFAQTAPRAVPEMGGKCLGRAGGGKMKNEEHRESRAWGRAGASCPAPGTRLVPAEETSQTIRHILHTWPGSQGKARTAREGWILRRLPGSMGMAGWPHWVLHRLVHHQPVPREEEASPVPSRGDSWRALTPASPASGDPFHL